jgi:hypothetical protein
VPNEGRLHTNDRAQKKRARGKELMVTVCQWFGAESFMKTSADALMPEGTYFIYSNEY